MSELATKSDLGRVYWMLWVLIILTVMLIVFVDAKHKRVEANLQRRVGQLEQGK